MPLLELLAENREFYKLFDVISLMTNMAIPLRQKVKLKSGKQT